MWFFMLRLIDLEKNKLEQLILWILSVIMVWDEGFYFLEWIVYYWVVGIMDFLIFVNDCSDGIIVFLKVL